MAEKIIRMLLDDMEDEEVKADQTVQFGLDGKTYEIDLSTKNAMRLRNELEKYIENGRLISTRPVRPHRPTVTEGGGSASLNGNASGMDPDQLRACRAWARSNGWPNLRDKGRIPREILDAYHNRTDSPSLQFSAS